MNPAIDISSVISDVNLPKRNLEAVANFSRSKHGVFTNHGTYPGYENISWRFISTLAIGNVQMTLLKKENNKFIYREIPASVFFMAACTKGQSGDFNLQFGISMS